MAESGTCDVRLFNVILLGVAFMLLFTAFQTCSMVEKVVVDSAKNDTNFTGDAYTSLGIIYGVFSVSNWVAPSIVGFLGPKISLLCSSSLYFLFILSFLKPMEWALYLGSVLVGFGAAVLWTAQGNFLTINSDSETIARNSGIFWALLQCSLLFGNMYSYFVFQGKSRIASTERTHLFIGLSGAAFLGMLVFVFLRRRRPQDTDTVVNLNASTSLEISGVASNPQNGLKRSFQLFKTREMILLSFMFAYTGIELTFFSGVYGTCVNYNLQFGDSRNGLLGISGMLIGVGEIIGGGMFGLFGKRTNKYGRDPIVLFGYLVHMTAFYLIYLNMPNESPIKAVLGPTHMQSSQAVALLCSFLLGLGDSSFNTQAYSLLGYLYPEDSSPAFALFKFMQSIAAAAAFYYSTALLLQWQLLILVVMGTLGTMCFNLVEWKSARPKPEGYEPIGGN